MYRKIRITVASLVIVTVCMLSSAGTLSYFTDTDAVTNEFTIGRVSTTLAIYNHPDGGEEHVFNADDYPLLINTVDTDGDGTPDDIPFYLQATNEGNISVYQRFRVVVPNAIAGVVTLNLLGEDDNCVIPSESNTCSNDNYTVTYVPPVEGDTSTNAEYYIVSNRALAPNDLTSEWPTTGIHVDGIENVNSELLTCNGDTNHCVSGISVYSDAVQSAGFENAEEAFASLEETH